MVKFLLRVRKVHRWKPHRAKKCHVTCVMLLGKALSSLALLTRAFLVPVVCGKYYSQSADMMFDWPSAVVGEAK